MQIVSVAGGPNLTGPQFWATRGCLPLGGGIFAAGVYGFSFSGGFDGRGVGATPLTGDNIVGPTVVLNVPFDGNAAHALLGKTFTLVVMGLSRVWTLTESPPGSATDIQIANGDDAATVAGKIETAFNGNVDSAYGTPSGIVSMARQFGNPDGSVSIQIVGLDLSLAGAMHLTGSTGPAPNLTAPIPYGLSTGGWGFKLLRNAGRAFVYQGLGESNRPVGSDASTLSIVGWPLRPGPGKWAGVPRVGVGVLIQAPG